MLGVAGSFSILLPEPPASSSHRTLPARMRGKLRRYGLLAGRAANLHIFQHHIRSHIARPHIPRATYILSSRSN
jgi:hypothetical protein